jgi:hypothetical protein
MAGHIFKNLEEVRAAAITFKDRYNRHWRLEKLGFISPLEARQARQNYYFNNDQYVLLYNTKLLIS